MSVRLENHPDTERGDIASIEAQAERARETVLTAQFTLRGAIDSVVIPAEAPPTRADRLWEHTCFEAFIRPVGSTSYLELNFAPSRAWAAYRFDDYRAGMRNAALSAPLRLERVDAPNAVKLEIAVDLAGEPNFPAHSDWRIGLSAVIESANASKSYWALAHPSERPDFHHADGFALDLPARG